MFHVMSLFFGIGFAGVAALATLVAIAYPVSVAWMIIDGVLRVDAEYPGAEPNRKVLWVLLMVLIHPATILYFFAVFSRVKRGSLVQAPCVAAPAA